MLDDCTHLRTWMILYVLDLHVFADQWVSDDIHCRIQIWRTSSTLFIFNYSVLSNRNLWCLTGYPRIIFLLNMVNPIILLVIYMQLFRRRHHANPGSSISELFEGHTSKIELWRCFKISLCLGINNKQSTLTNDIKKLCSFVTLVLY